MDEKVEAEFEKWRDENLWEVPVGYPTALLRMAFKAGWKTREAQA